MDRILSARIDESLAERLNSLSRQLHTSKKNILERAIELFSKNVDSENCSDVLDQTFGAWKRKESARRTVLQARSAFKGSMERHQS